MQDIKEWITINHQHIPVKEGQNKNDVVKDFINKKKSNNKINKDIKIYRAGTDIGQLESGTFFSPSKQDADNYGEAKEYTIDKTANIYEGKSSQDYAKENNLLDIKDNLLKEKLGVDNLREIENIYNEWITPSYLDKNPNLYFFAHQYMTMKDLKNKGYDGAYWKWEDDLTPQQYQIWNNKIFK